MSCASCHFENQGESTGQVAIHFPGLKGLDRPIVWVFPRLLVCLNCGFTEFVVPEIELRRLVDGDTTEYRLPKFDCGALAVGRIPAA